MASAWITLTWARPGQGKGLDTARRIRKMFREYRKTEKRYPDLPKRVMLCNLKLSSALEQLHLLPDGIHRDLEYWENPRQLRYCNRSPCFTGKVEKHSVHDVDIVIDEIAQYCPSDGWKDLPRWLRKMFAQHRHRGIRIVANTQDYKAVDINFRRMVAKAFKVRKVFSSRDPSPTMPPVKSIFGLVIRREFEPDQIEEEGATSEKLEQLRGMPHFFWISRKLVEMYDSYQDLPEYMPNTLEHVELTCEDPNCKEYHKHKPKVVHRTV